MTLTYGDALDFLFPRTTTIKFGLATTRALLRSLGNPHEVMPSVHIGGTNGKGSISTLVAAALRQDGWRVGLYTSPHLVSFRERILVDGVPISEDALAMWTNQLHGEILERKATFFEASTAIAFADFAARGVEIAVVEVGLGGRLDSTNVIQPLVSAVTKIERDHMKYLGKTLESIACEKAGIAKPGVPFVIGERTPALVDVLRREAHKSVARLDPDGTRRCSGPARGIRVEGCAQPGRAPSAPKRRHRPWCPYGPPGAIPARTRRRGAWIRAGQGRGTARPAGEVALRRRAQSGWDAGPDARPRGHQATATDPRAGLDPGR